MCERIRMHLLLEGLEMIKRLLCAVLGHRYVVERVMNAGARKVGCTRCRNLWAMHDGTRSFVPWDGDLEALYAPGGILAESLKLPPNVELTGALASELMDGLGDQSE